MNGIREKIIWKHNVISNRLAAYEKITGRKNHGQMATQIQMSYSTSLCRMTYGEFMQGVAQSETERIGGMASGLMVALYASYITDYQNPRPYDGNLDARFRYDQMELNSKNGFKNYDYVPLSGETLKWLREKYPMETDPNFIGPRQLERTEKQSYRRKVTINGRTCEVKAGPNVESSARSTKGQASSSYDYQQYKYSLIMEEVSGDSRPIISGAPLKMNVFKIFLLNICLTKYGRTAKLMKLYITISKPEL